MLATPLFFSAVILAAPPAIATKLAEVAPNPQTADEIVRSPKQERAVVLVHGYRVFTKEEAVSVPDFRDWQKPGCALVKELAKNADVFSFGYGQNGDIDSIVAAGGLGEGVARLRKAGYREIILVGHSAGGLVARQFVEDNPDAGVTKVVQVCSPNGGTPAATGGSLKSQREFVECLSLEGRQKCLKERAAKALPEKVQFVCILSNFLGATDGLVPCNCQWTPDLQKQGVPVVVVSVVHPQLPRAAKGIEAIAAAVKQDQPRWKPERVEIARKELFDKRP